MNLLRFLVFSLRTLAERMTVVFVEWWEDFLYDFRKGGRYHDEWEDDGPSVFSSLTPEEIENVANAMLEYHFETPKDRKKSLQKKPLLAALRESQSARNVGLCEKPTKGETDNGVH